MGRVARAIAVCASLTAFASGSHAFASPLPLSLTSFGAPQIISASSLGAPPDDTLSLGFDVGSITVLPGAYGGGLPSTFATRSFANSLALSPNLALDSGYNLDIAARFGNYDRFANPLLDAGASFLALADGGHYAGVTYVAADLSLRVGGSLRNDRLDSFAFAPMSETGLPLVFDRSQTRSILAGVSWDLSDWGGIGMDAISSTRSGTPLGYTAGSLTDQSSTNALDVSARFNLGDNWATHIDYAQGLTQLDQRSGGVSEQGESYSITVAKHGVFGDDAVGFSLSRPASGMIGSFTSLTAPEELPPMMLAHSQTTAVTAPETDFQLGYVTSFLGGKLALQTNAGYQMNVQGQTGATAVSVLSSAKVKF